MPDRPIRSLHVITGLWKNTGGPAETVPALTAALCRAGDHVTLATLAGDSATAVGTAEGQGVLVHRFAPTMRHTIWYSRTLASAMPRLVAEHDVVHVHAMWQWPGWAAATEARRLGKPLVLSPRGSVLPERLKKSAWKKRLVGGLKDRPLMTAAAAVHATSAEEAVAVRRFGYYGPVAIVPNGIAVPRIASDDERTVARQWLEARYPQAAGRRKLLFMSRIEPTKGVVTLANAWNDVATRFPEWVLVIAGPDERNYAREVAAAINAGAAGGSTIFTGPLYDDDRERAYRAADVFVLPTRSENFGMVVGEALARGVPVITTHGAPWSGLQSEHCGWWVEPTRRGIGNALSCALALPPKELRALGQRGRAWMARDFGWDRIAGQMHDLYAWTLNAGSRPACVQIVE